MLAVVKALSLELAANLFVGGVMIPNRTQLLRL